MHAPGVPTVKHRDTPITEARQSEFPPSLPCGQQLAACPVQQTSPGHMHPAGLSQRLTPLVVSPRHELEQQFSSASQISPMGLQPLTYWHTAVPVPGSAQAPVQHSWCPVQGSPAVWHWANTGQRPLVPQTPLQQSALVLQASPPKRHIVAEATQTFLAPSLASQRPVQHSADAAQLTPLALHSPV